MPTGKPITIIQVRAAADHYATFGSWSAAAKHVGLSYSGLLRAMKETFTEERDDAVDRFRDRIRVERVERAFARDDKSSSWFLQHLATEHLPETQAALQKRTLELTGPDGGPLEVTVEHDYGRLLDKLREAGVLQGGAAAGVVDAAPVALLPARSD